VNKKPPIKEGKTLTGRERNLHFSKLPKRKHRKGRREPSEKIKEREERKKKKKVGARLPWRLRHPR
jgi:hypothetical protein